MLDDYWISSILVYKLYGFMDNSDAVLHVGANGNHSLKKQMTIGIILLHSIINGIKYPPALMRNRNIN
jgi:hypothetical protein